MKNPGTSKFMFPIQSNRDRLRLAIQETRGMFVRHKNKAPWAIDSVQETFLREKGEGKIKVLSPEETEEILETKSCNFPRIDIVYNLDSPSTRARLIYNFTRMVKGSTLSLEILSGENGLGNLSECGFSFRVATFVRSFDISECYTQVRTSGCSKKGNS